MPYTPFYNGGWKDYPNTTTPITAASLNHIESGIVEAAKSGGGGASYVSYQGSTRTQNYYFEIYKHNVTDASTLSNNMMLTDPYYYYTIEGWAKMSNLNTDAFGMTASEIHINTFDNISGTDFYDNILNTEGRWLWYPEMCLLGTAHGDDSRNYGYFDPLSPSDARYLLSRPWATITPYVSGTLAGTIQFNIGVNSIPVTDDTLKFTNNDINSLAVYFKIKIDQIRKEGLG